MERMDFGVLMPVILFVMMLKVLIAAIVVVEEDLEAVEIIKMK